MKSASTPYEIRLSLLQLAHDILRDTAGANGVVSGTDYPLQPPTTEEIIAEAARLNVFVSNNQTR